MSFSIKDVDHGLEELMRDMRKLAAKEHSVKIGMVGPRAEETRDGGTTNLDVALFNEYGTRTIPARPWIGPSFDKNRAKYERQLAKGLEAVYEGRGDVETLLGRLGAEGAADMKNYVTQGAEVPPPNAPGTLEHKQAKGDGDPRTLVDTGQMVGAVSWEVE